MRSYERFKTDEIPLENSTILAFGWPQTTKILKTGKKKSKNGQKWQKSKFFEKQLKFDPKKLILN